MFFSKKIRTNSESQFKSDFGEYPPKPLSSMKLNTQFNILSMGKVGLFFHSVSRTFSVIFLTMSGKPPFHSNSRVMIYMRNLMIEMRKGISETKSSFTKLATQLKKSPFQMNFVLFVLLMIACSPLVLLFIIFFVMLICIRLLILSARKSGHNSFGFFTRLPNASSQITVNTVALRRAKNSADKLERTVSFESVVSHEHIHLLQTYYLSERVKYEDETEKVNFLKSLLKDPENDFAFTSYFFKINEMEARLHEVVLSYYRNQGELPLDETGFNKLLFGSKSEVMNNVKKAFFGKLENRPYRKRIAYEVRCGADEHEMISSIFHLTDPWGYLLKVLPVMYGNLLILYGDTNRAKKYLETVSSFELYNQLYGEVIIPA